MRILSAIVVAIALVAAVSVAYVQCGSDCGTPAAACDSCAKSGESISACSSCQSDAKCADCPKADCDGDCDTCECPEKCADCPKADCDGDCDTCECPEKCADCPKADCDGDCDTCDCAKAASCAKAGKCGSDCAKVDGTVRYVRSTNKAVKVMAGEKGYLLRVGGECGGCPKSMAAQLADLEKGDAVTATFQKCPESGKLYLCALKSVAVETEEPAPKPEGTSSGPAPSG